MTYAGESFLTSDSVADALIDLTASLGRTQKAEVVELAAVDAHGKAQLVRLVIGPASQIVTIHVDSALQEPEAGDVVARLKAKTRATETRNIAVPTASVPALFDPDEDELDSP